MRDSAVVLFVFAAVSVWLLAGCAAPSPAAGGKPVPKEADHSSLSHLVKADMDRLADVEYRENTDSLKLLMIKLYKRNPRELRKSSTAEAEGWVSRVFDHRTDWHFSEINGAQGTDAIHQALRADFTGDRVLSLIVGLQTMLIKAHGGKTEFYLIDSIDPQAIYNVARNIEITVWKLSNARDEDGQLLLLSNESNEGDRNLSFEREFGKMIGRLDMFAVALAEKSQRALTRVVQTMATALFLPF
ncbi:MAG: hypothetical protein U1C96_09780 [Gallionella sp.]|nr:hypothetical protein [Gallionella sp.]